MSSLPWEGAMGKSYADLNLNIPWTSIGRETVISRAGRGVVPIGVLPFQPSPPVQVQPLYISSSHPEFEQYLMHIIGTAIQADSGKLVTCAHIVEGLVQQPSRCYILAPLIREGVILFTPYAIQCALPYVDPRSNDVNPEVDLSALIVVARSTETLPYEVPPVRWGDSTQVGVGDPVMVGGFPYGRDMFLHTQTNRGLIQPAFQSGIVSAIIPATNTTETRIFQISVPSAGGMSGGAVFDQNTGEVIGMVTSCMHAGDIPLPTSYAIPSEIIAPYLEIITFQTDDRPSEGA